MYNKMPALFETGCLKDFGRADTIEDNDEENKVVFKRYRKGTSGKEL